MNEKIYPISRIVTYIKSTLDKNPYLSGILIQGEVSNLTKHRSGHWYFTLKDSKARLSCVMFASYASRCRFDVQDGAKVIIKGSISLYEPQGSVQCYVTQIRGDGLGELYVRFEQLKKKLYEEGWFNEDHKQQLPEYAENIGVITAKEGAALQDVLSTIHKRWPIARVSLYPAYVQGEQASSSIIDALTEADQHGHDCLLLVRGGGSIEDLWGFNSEDLVHCIYHLKTPVVSGVGHESDTTLVDYVCDLRAPTPTGAAQRATPDQRDVLRLLYSHKQYLSTRMKQLLDQQKGALAQRRHHRYLQDPYSYVKDRQMHLAMAQTQLDRIGDAMLENKTKLTHLKQLLVHSLQQCVSEQRQLCSHKEEQLKEQLGLYYAREAQKLSSRMTLLDAYSPLAVLKRGYTLVEQDGMLCKSASALQQESEVRIRFHDGKWRAKLLEKEEDHEGKINI